MTTPPRLARHLVLVVVALVVAAGCAGGSSGGGATVSGAPTTKQLDEHANGSTVDVQLGDTVVVVLHSTYWSFAVPKSALQPLGEPQPSPSHCTVVGSGCGTVTARYNATHVGQTTLQAHRDSCGEALRCAPSDSDWSVTVRVS